MGIASSKGETLVQHSKPLNQKLSRQILNFCKHVAGSGQITAICVCGDYALGYSDAKTLVEVSLIIRDFQPRLMNYVKVFDERTIIVCAVDQWVFGRDVDRGFLGEALAGGLIFPYIPLVNEDYLLLEQIKLKKRLIRELLENLVLEFPELSYEIYIKPEYFMYETMLSRARLLPPMIYSLLNFMREDVKAENIERTLHGYLEALKELEKEKVISFSDGYVRISAEFVDKARSRRVRFINLFKPAQKVLFTSLLGIFPKIVSSISQNIEMFPKLQKVDEEDSKVVHEVEDPQRYLFVPTATGLVPLASRMDIEAFARKTLSAGKDAEIEIEEIGGVLNDAYLVKARTDGEERKIVVKRFRDWSSFKWFPLTLWTFGTRTFAVLGRSRLERECAINRLLYSNGFAVPRVLHVSPGERLIFMEYVEGESLEKIIKRIVGLKAGSEMDKELTIINGVGEKFAGVHTLGIALGDTKPENVMVGKNGEIYLLDFEQASRNGDKAWDIAEFLFYAGHYVSPFVGTRPAELIAKAFIKGYLKAGGSSTIVKKAGNPKYTKVFSIFTLPHIIFVISNVCRKADKLEE
jgi:tRNA A-37 threonylcarbamoyl transferase component Bud32